MREVRLWSDSYGHSGRRYFENEKAASLWLFRVGSTADWRGFPFEMSGLRASDYDSTAEGGKKCARRGAESVTGKPKVELLLESIKFPETPCTFSWTVLS